MNSSTFNGSLVNIMVISVAMLVVVSYGHRKGWVIIITLLLVGYKMCNWYYVHSSCSCYCHCVYFYQPVLEWIFWFVISISCLGCWLFYSDADISLKCYESISWPMFIPHPICVFLANEATVQKDQRKVVSPPMIQFITFM